MRQLSIGLLLGLCAWAAVSQADLTLVRTLDLEGDTHHVQGIDLGDERLWVSSVDKESRQGYLQEFSTATGKLLRSATLAEGERFHPGGMSSDGKSLWIPVAEYRRHSTSVIQKRNLRSLELEFSFTVDDHIGCLAVTPTELIGGNWDSREFYVWDHQGRLLRKVANPTPNGYQDMKYFDGKLVAAGLLPRKTGAIDWLDAGSFRLLQRVPIGQTSRGVPFTNEGMALRGDQLFLLPEDAPSRLFQFRLTGVAAK